MSAGSPIVMRGVSAGLTTTPSRRMSRALRISLTKRELQPGLTMTCGQRKLGVHKPESRLVCELGDRPTRLFDSRSS